MYNEFGSSSNVAKGLVAQTGPPTSLNLTINLDCGHRCIITGDVSLLQNYKSNNDHASISIFYVSNTQITGTGSNQLTNVLEIHYALNVPDLYWNLSISKLSCDLHCETKFYPNLLIFQGLKSMRNDIGLALYCKRSEQVID